MHDSLTLTLELKGTGDTLSVPCSSVLLLNTSIHSYGFDGIINFILNNKEAEFLHKLPVINIKLTIFPSRAPQDIKPIELNGIVTRKTLLNESFSPDPDANNLSRTYSLEFKDPLQVIWSKHYPVEIFTQKKMEDVINEYLPSTVKLNVEAEPLKEEQPLIALGLGEIALGQGNQKNPALLIQRDTGKVSFYSFLMWYLSEIDAIWEYDYEQQQYVIRDKKDDSPEPVDLPHDVGEIIVHFPEPPRQDIRIRNSFASDPTIKKIDGEEAFEKISKDLLVENPLKKEIDQFEARIKPQPNAYGHQLDFYFNLFPYSEISPGAVIYF